LSLIRIVLDLRFSRYSDPIVPAVKHVFEKPGVLTLLLGGPLMLDLLVSFHMLYVNLRTVDLGVPPRYQCMLSVMWSVGYVIGAHCAGRWCTPKRSGSMMTLSLLGTAVITCFVFLVKPDYLVFLAANIVLGLLIAFYFAPFQVKMGHIHPFHSMATVVAVYNISWGTGFALGALGCGWLLDMPEVQWIACGLVITITVIHLLLLGCVDGKDGKEERTSEEITGAFASTPLQRWCGWIGTFVSFAIIGSISATLWPNFGRENGMSSFQIGVGSFVMIVQLPLLSLLWARSCERMRNPVMLIFLVATMGAGCLMIPLSGHGLWQFVLLGVVGAGASGAIFHAVYYSNADPINRERSVGINETVVGFAFIFGPSTMGWLAWDSGASMRPYIAGFSLALVACAVIAFLWVRSSSPKGVQA